MSPTKRDIYTQKERERCRALVKGYREQIEAAILNPKYKKVDRSLIATGEAVVRSLLYIEEQIIDPHSDVKRGSGSDFTIEELEKAEAILAEQNHNPFEEDVS